MMDDRVGNGAAGLLEEDVPVFEDGAHFSLDGDFSSLGMRPFTYLVQKLIPDQFVLFKDSFAVHLIAIKSKCV